MKIVLNLCVVVILLTGCCGPREYWYSPQFDQLQRMNPLYEIPKETN